MGNKSRKSQVEMEEFKEMFSQTMLETDERFNSIELRLVILSEQIEKLKEDAEIMVKSVEKAMRTVERRGCVVMETPRQSVQANAVVLSRRVSRLETCVKRNRERPRQGKSVTSPPPPSDPAPALPPPAPPPGTAPAPPPAAPPAPPAAPPPPPPQPPPPQPPCAPPTAASKRTPSRDTPTTPPRSPHTSCSVGVSPLQSLWRTSFSPTSMCMTSQEHAAFAMASQDTKAAPKEQDAPKSVRSSGIEVKSHGNPATSRIQKTNLQSLEPFDSSSDLAEEEMEASVSEQKAETRDVFDDPETRTRSRVDSRRRWTCRRECWDCINCFNWCY